MPWMTAAAIGGGALLNYFGGQQASSAAQSIASQQLAAQQQWQKLVDPFASSGKAAEFTQIYTPQLQDLVAHPEQIQNNPLFQSEQKFGEQAVSRNQAAIGNLNSGAEMTALADYSRSHANQFYNQQYERLAQLSGMSKTPQTSAATGTMTPSLSYNMTAAPFAGAAQALGTMSSIYGGNNTSSGTPTTNTTAGNMSLPNSNGTGNSPFYTPQW